MLNQINNPLLIHYVFNLPLVSIMLLLVLSLLLFIASLLLLSLALLSLLLTVVHTALITRSVFLSITGAEHVGWGLCPTKINGVGGAQAPPYILRADFIWPRNYGGMYLTPLPLLIPLTFTLTVIVNPPVTVNRFVIANPFIIPSEAGKLALQNFKPCSLHFAQGDKV